MSEKHLPIPDTIEEITTFRGQGLKRSWKMHPAALVFLSFFCVIWFSFLGFWYFGVSRVFSDMGPLGLLFVLFPLGHVAVGIGLLYMVVTSCVNSTQILVDGRSLVIYHGPLPWPGNKEVPLAEIAQLYVIEANSTDSYGRVSRYYQVNMIDLQNKQHKLLPRLQSAAEALYIEKRMEQLMSLADEPVVGEFRS